MRPSTCVVQNAGGFTSLEALAAGVPRHDLPLHPRPRRDQRGRTRARPAWSPWARDAAEPRRAAAGRACAGPDGSAADAARPAHDLVGRGCPRRRRRVPHEPAPGWPVRAVLGAAARGRPGAHVRRLRCAGARLLPRLAGISGRPHVALTYDDGPGPGLDAALPRPAGPPRASPRRSSCSARTSRGTARWSREMAARGPRARRARVGPTACLASKRPGPPRRRAAAARWTLLEDAHRRAPVRWYRPPYGVLTAAGLLRRAPGRAADGAVVGLGTRLGAPAPRRAHRGARSSRARSRPAARCCSTTPTAPRRPGPGAPRSPRPSGCWPAGRPAASRSVRCVSTGAPARSRDDAGLTGCVPLWVVTDRPMSARIAAARLFGLGWPAAVPVWVASPGVRRQVMVPSPREGA